MAPCFSIARFQGRSRRVRGGVVLVVGYRCAGAFRGPSSSAGAFGLRSRAFPSPALSPAIRAHPGGEPGQPPFRLRRLGYTSIAAHGHADALSFTLAFRSGCFVDPGTFDYFTYPEWRKYFRSTAATNTAEIDGEDQSAMLGPFSGNRAVFKMHAFRDERAGGSSGATRRIRTFVPPARHSRTVEMEAESGAVIVSDEFLSEGAHNLRILFHVAENCPAHVDGAHGSGSRRDPRSLPRCGSGALGHTGIRIRRPIAGWVSRAITGKPPLRPSSPAEGHRELPVPFQIRREGCMPGEISPSLP